MGQPRLSGKRILVVDDNRELAKLVATAIADRGGTADVVLKGSEALALVEDGAPAGAIVDLLLPDVLGTEVLAALKRKGIPAVAVSGAFRGAPYDAESRQLGAVAFFEKPFDLAEVIGALERAIGQQDAPAEGDPALAQTAEPPGPGSSGPPPEVPSPAEATSAPETSPPPEPARAPDFSEEPTLPGARAADLIDDASASRDEPAGAPEKRPSNDTRQGDLGTTTVPTLLNAFHAAKATGVLTLTHGKVRKLVYLEKGIPRFGASNLSSDRFGQYCVRRGLVGADQLAQVVAELRPPERTGDALVTRGILAPEQRASIVTEQVQDIIWSTFEWRAGGYKFELKSWPTRELVQLQLTTGNLILSGIRRTATLERLRAELDGSVALAPAPDPLYQLYELEIPPPEARLVVSADGTKSVSDLVAIADLPERDALAFLYAMRLMGLLDEVRRVLATTRRIAFM